MADATNDPDELTRLLVERPDDADLWQRLGLTLLRRMNLEEAAHAFLRAIELPPRGSLPWLYLGHILEGISPTAARSMYEIAAEVMPDLPAAYWCQGLLARREGRFVQATEMFQKAVEIGPTDLTSMACLREWQSFVSILNGRRGFKYWIWARTWPGVLLSDRDATSLTDAARAAIDIESVYFINDGQYADVEADVVADDVKDDAALLAEYEAFCASRHFPAMADDGRPVPTSAQQFNWSRWGQRIFTVVPPANEDLAAEAYSRVIAFAREHALTLTAAIPGTGDIDLANPGRLPPAWNEWME